MINPIPGERWKLLWQRARGVELSQTRELQGQAGSAPDLLLQGISRLI